MIGIFPIGLATNARAQSNPILNGDFGDGLNHWTTTIVTAAASYPRFEIHTHESWWALNPSFAIDSPLGSDGYIEQAFTMPVTSSATLSFWTWGHGDPVVATVSMIDEGGEHVLEQYDPACKQDTGCTTPEMKNYDVTSFSGKTVTLRLRSTSTFSTGTFAQWDELTITTPSLTISGFYAPVDNQPTLNEVKNGATVPLKFEVFEALTEVTDPSVVESLRATKVDCVSLDGSTDTIELTSTGATSLRYDTTEGFFIYNWKTPKQKDTCWIATISLVSGAGSISANFRLN